MDIDNYETCHVNDIARDLFKLRGLNEENGRD